MEATFKRVGKQLTVQTFFARHLRFRSDPSFSVQLLFYITALVHASGTARTPRYEQTTLWAWTHHQCLLRVCLCRPRGRSYSWVPFQETGLTNSEAKHELWVDEAWDGKLCFPVSRTSSLSPLSFWGWTPSVFISGLNRPAHLNSADLLNNDRNNHNIHELTGAMVLVRQAGRGRGDLTEWGQSEVAVPDGWASNLNNFFGTDPKLYADEMPVLYILMLLVFRNIWHLRNVASC